MTEACAEDYRRLQVKRNPLLDSSFQVEAVLLDKKGGFGFYCKSAFAVEVITSTPGVSNLRTSPN